MYRFEMVIGSGRLTSVAGSFVRADLTRSLIALRDRVNYLYQRINAVYKDGVKLNSGEISAIERLI